MKKRILSLLCVLCLMLTMLPTSAFAAGYDAPTLSIEASYDSASSKVTAKVILGACSDLGALDFHMKYDLDKLAVESIVGNEEFGSEDYTTISDNTATTKDIGLTFVKSSGMTVTGTKLVFTATFSVKPGQTGDAQFAFDDYYTNFSHKNGEDTASTPAAGSVTTTTVTIPKAPITSVTIADLNAPVKGAAPDTSVTVTPSSLAADVKWFDGATPVTGNFAANTAYTVKIKLTASGGDNFAETVTASGYDVTRNSGTELLLTKTFDATADKDPLTGFVLLHSSAWRIDNPMNVSTSGITSTSPGTLSYKWYRVDHEGNESPIVGETAKTYTPKVAADVGKKIKVVVTAENYSGHLEATSPYTVSKKPYDGPTPTAPTGITPTSNFVSFTKTENYYYAVTSAAIATAPSSGWTNQDGFTGLSPNTSYKLWYRIGETDIMESSSAAYVDFTTLKSSATITIAAPGTIIYDGSAVEVGSGKDLSYTYSGDGAVTVKWYANNGGSVGSALSGAPTNAGTYWIGVSAAEGTNSAAVSEVTKKFTISPRNISEVTVASIADKEYTGSSIEPPLTVTYNGPLAGTDYTVEYTSNLNVGTATATIKAKTGGNFIGEKAVTFKIKAKAITPVVTVTGSYEYTGDPITPTYKVEITSGGMELPANQYDAVVSDNTNAGNGNIKITAKANGNYSFSEINETFAIAAKNVSSLPATISNQTTIRGVGEFVDPVIKGVKGEDLTGTLTYAYDSETGKFHADVVNMLKGKNVNDVVTLTYTFTPPSGNYTGTKTGSFKVTVKDIEFLVGTAPASVANTLTVKSSPVYGDNWSDIVKKQTGVTITAKVGAAIDTEQSHFTLRPTGKPNAGNGQTYELVYNGTINGTNYANVVVVSGTVDVAPKTLTKSDLVYTSQITKTYDGSDSAPTGLSISVKPTSLVGTDTLTVTGTLKYNSANVNAANEITFTPTAITTGNYRLAATEVLTITGAKITAKDVKLTGGINATDRSYVKDNKTVDLTKGTLTFDGLVGSETLDVNIPATGTISDAKVGAYNVTYSGVTLADGTGKASNYKLVSPLPAVMVNITKAAALTLADIPVSQKFTTTTGEKAIGAVMPTDAGALTYTKDAESKTGSVTVTSWDVDSTGKVTYTLSGGVAGDTVTLPVTIGSDNYENSTVNVKITLTAKDDQTALTLTGGTTVVYGQPLQLGTTGGNGTGAVTYAVTNGTGEATIDATGKLTPVKVGTVKVKATKAEDANYNAITSAEVEIHITRATPTGAPKYTAITTSGKTLADAGLTTTGSTLNPNAGTLVWVDNADNVLPGTTAVAANTTYKWLFTPTDANYTTLTGSIELYHKSSSGGGGWYYTYYTIKATAGTNGSISPSGWTSVRDGRDQTFTITPDKGYAVAKVLVDGKSVGAVKSYTFKNVTKDHTIEAIFMKSNGNPQTGVFVDVAEGSYYEEAIDWAVEKGITNGVSSNMFAPNDPCTRAQIVTFLWRAAGSPAPKSMSSFTDVPADAFYAKAVAWAVENGITSGTGESKFSPNSTCTRAQAVTFLYRASGSPAVSGKAEFSDVSTTAFYADAVTWAAKKGITTGIGGGLFGSDNDCTRGQIVTFLWRAMAE